MTGAGTFQFTDCGIQGAPFCVVPAIITSLITIHTKTVGGKKYFIFLPATGTEFVNTVIEECALEGEFPISGSFAGFDVNAETESTSHTFQFSATISSEAGTEMKFGVNGVTLAGSSALTMSPSFSVR